MRWKRAAICFENFLLVNLLSLLFHRKFPVPPRGESHSKPLNLPVELTQKLLVEWPILRNSLLFSLLAGNADWFVSDCVLSQPVLSLNGMSIAQKSARYSPRVSSKLVSLCSEKSDLLLRRRIPKLRPKSIDDILGERLRIAVSESVRQSAGCERRFLH
jgi:hypothetical protein